MSQYKERSLREIAAIEAGERKRSPPLSEPETSKAATGPASPMTKLSGHDMISRVEHEQTVLRLKNQFFEMVDTEVGEANRKLAAVVAERNLLLHQVAVLQEQMRRKNERIMELESLVARERTVPSMN
jgi:hypothetical protein